jgi:exodeoxyribonuclease V alpha subunit
MANDNQDVISGSVERVTYYNSENGYTVLRLKPDEKGMLPFQYASPRHQLVTVVGNLPEVNPGEWLKLTGEWTNHPKHGRQFQARKCEQSLPATAEGVKRYLGSGLVRGIGPVMAERIVDEFGVEALDVIELEPGRLREVPGIGPKRIDGIIEAWEEQRAIKDVMLFLQSHGVSTNLAIKIYKQYGDEALLVVQNTPYKLVQDVYGVGFKTADRIAQALGLEHDSTDRIEAGIAYTLVKMADDGHVYVPEEELEPETEKILAVDVEKISTVMQSLEQSQLIRRETLTYELKSETEKDSELKEEKAVYLTPLYFSEVGVAKRLRKLIEHPTSRLTALRAVHVEGSTADKPLIETVQPGVFLTEQQRMAVHTAINSKVTVLTGGPGTGKTTTLRSLLDLLDQYRLHYALASPTGRAAKRLTEATGRPAKTIHRLLEYNPGEGFGRGEEDPLEADMIIVDEASMLDLALTHNLLKAISPDSHLLLVGDVDQLPSVGAGDVLRDLIKSGVTAVIRLETIFRQASDSLIISNAHRINQGLMPETPKDTKDFFLFIKEDSNEAADLLIDIVNQRLPTRFGLDPFDDVQVLSPMYQGSTGVLNLNQKLQHALNPPGKKVERILNNQTMRVGDKVMQTANNYDKNVYNGDIGRVTEIDPIKQTMTVSIDGAPVVYDFLEADELMHAFAISVHKSQGSEYPCVVMPVMTQHYMLLQRNLLYTAVTRAKRMVVLVGTRKAIGIAINNNRVSERYTALDWRLNH